MADAAQQVAIITGGNTGIGKATAVDVARRGLRVAFTSRDAERGKRALDDIRKASGSDAVDLLALDLASLASVRACAAEILERYPRIDLLINNAGVALTRGARQTTHDGFEMQFGVNHLGHFLFTNLLLDRIRASAPARIVNLSSAGYLMAPEGLNFDDLQMEQGYQGFACYGHSKLANIWFTLELAKRLEGSGVTANAVHPGYVETELGHLRPEDKERFVKAPKKPGGKSGGKSEGGPDLSALGPPLSPEDGAATTLYVAFDPAADGVTGRYFADVAEQELTPVGADAESAARLWAVSEELIAGAG